MNQSDADPERIVCKLQVQNFYQRGAKYKGLDPRGMAIIQAENRLYLWIGEEMAPANYEPYLKAGHDWVSNLQKHERASQDLITVKQGQEDNAFWQVFGLEERPS